MVLLEAFQPGHRRGSSHGSARIFRRAYTDPLYVRLTGQAQVLWQQLADEAGEELVTNTGAIDSAGPHPGEDVRDPDRVRGARGADTRRRGGRTMAWPVVRADPVMFHPDGGVIDPERAMAAMRAIAAARGAQVCYGAPVLRVEAGGEGAAVHTADRSWRAPVVVVAAGAWLEPLLGGQVPLPPLVVTQEEAFHFAPAAPGRGLADVHLLRDGVMYGLPAGRDGEVPGAVKIGTHHGGGADNRG